MLKNGKESDSRKKEKTARQKVRPLALLLILIGLSVILYPTVSSLWNDYRQGKIITAYRESIESKADCSEELEKAAAYNEQLAAEGYIEWNKTANETNDEYESLLNIAGNGTMGYIDIPKIAVTLPIYHYYTEENTESVGHVCGSSLPVGGSGTHCVLAAHRGVPSAKLFTDLDELEPGDMFYLHVLGETLAYEVDDIRTVEPEEAESIRIEDGGDYVTLMTCTPYGVNTHRLLVRGKRAAYNGESTETNLTNTIAHQIDKNQIAGFIMLAALSLIILIIKIKTGKEEKT